MLYDIINIGVDNVTKDGTKIVLSNDENRYEKDCKELPEVDYVKYGKDWDMVCSKEEYIKFHSYIKGIKQKFLKGNLSPLEKLIITYDIVRCKQYNRSGDESLDGLPHNVAFGKYINCRGYCSLMKEILTGEGIELEIQPLYVFDKEGNLIDQHARLTVILDDDKYGIHGMYTISPTEDSYKEYYKTTLSPDIKPTDLYCWLLRPFTDPNLYHSDNLEYRLSPLLADDDINLSGNDSFNINDEEQLIYLLSNYSLDKLSIMNDIIFDGLLSKIPQEKLLDYVNAECIDINTLMKAISNVRLYQGYNIENIKEEIDRIYDINEPFYYSNKENIVKN